MSYGDGMLMKKVLNFFGNVYQSLIGMEYLNKPGKNGQMKKTCTLHFALCT